MVVFRSLKSSTLGQQFSISGFCEVVRIVAFSLIISSFSSHLLAVSDRVLVVVNEDVITQSEYDKRLREFLLTVPPEQRQVAQLRIAKQMLETMISDKLQLIEARRRNLSISDEQLDAAIARFAEQRGFSAEELYQEVIKTGDTRAGYRQSVRETLVLQRLTEYYAQTQVRVPDYEIDAFLAQNNLEGEQIQYDISNIIIPASADIDAQSVVEEVNAGLDFAQAAERYSSAPNASEGGALGWREASQLPQIYIDVLREIRAGDVSQVIETPSANHIIRLNNTRGNRTEITQHSMQHILLKATTDVARSQAKKRLRGIRQQALDGADFDSLARQFSEDTVSAANGGELGWVSPGQMVPAFEREYRQMKAGEISEPFDSQYGVHIIKLNETRLKNVTEQITRSRAEAVLRQQRARREYDQWVQSLRQRAYVKYVNPIT